MANALCAQAMHHVLRMCVLACVRVFDMADMTEMVLLLASQILQSGYNISWWQLNLSWLLFCNPMFDGLVHLIVELNFDDERQMHMQQQLLDSA